MDKNNKKEENNQAVYTQIRSMKLNEDGKKFDVTLTIDGEVGEALFKADNPIVSALTFAAYAVQVASYVRQNANKKDANLSIKDCQDLASEQRPKIGKQSDPIKRKERDISAVKVSSQRLSDDELAAMGLQRVAQ